MKINGHWILVIYCFRDLKFPKTMLKITNPPFITDNEGFKFSAGKTKHLPQTQHTQWIYFPPSRTREFPVHTYLAPAPRAAEEWNANRSVWLKLRGKINKTPLSRGILSYTCSNPDGQRLPSRPRPLEFAPGQTTTRLIKCRWKWGKHYNSVHMPWKRCKSEFYPHYRLCCKR